MLAPERAAWEQGHRRVAGVDEAGRGPLAGPVFAAAVVLPPERLQDGIPAPWQGLTDSKQLTPARRELFFLRLSQDPAVRWCVAEASREEIDALNILRATHLAMARALAGLPERPDLALVDGRPAHGLPCPHLALVRGDALSLSIAAASVLAKVTRDRYLVELDRRYPGYGFARHKGYGTADHLRALRRLGPCAEHRRSFSPVAQAEPPRGGEARSAPAASIRSHPPPPIGEA
jgi:ribonuclease HII